MDSEEALSLLALAEDARVGLSGAEAARWMENLERRLGDLRAAAGWFLDHGEPERALRLVAALGPFWREGGRIADGRAWVDAILGHPAAQAPSAARARALCEGGLLTLRQGALEVARERAEEAVRMARAADDRPVELLAVTGLARVALREGNVWETRDLADKGLALARDMRDPGARVPPLQVLAAAARAQGEPEDARALYEESLELSRGLRDEHMVAVGLLNLGHVERDLGNLERSEERFREGLDLARRREGAGLFWECVVGMGCTAAARGDLERAARLLAAAEARLVEAGMGIDPDVQPEVDRAKAAVRGGVAGTRVRTLEEEGRALQRDEVLSLALER